MKNDDIKIKRASSSLSEFVERPLPSDEEVEAFDRYATNQIKDQEIKDSLTKIYEDGRGGPIDTQKLIIKKTRGLLFKFFTFTVVIFALGGSLYAAYNYVYSRINSDKQPVSLAFEAKKEVAAGEEFFYNLNYKNEDRVAVRNIEIKVKYPDSFIFLGSEPEPSLNNDTWEIGGLDPRRSNAIKIKGRLIGPLSSGNIILADMIYTPENFSSEFKKSADFSTAINDLGLDFSFANSSSALVNEENEINFKFKAKERNYLNNFRLSLEHGDEVQIIKEAAAASASGAPAVPLIKPSGPAAWDISNLGKNENEFKIKFKIKEKKQPKIDLKLKLELPFEEAGGSTRYYPFFEKIFTYDIIKSDLNINLIINGSPFDQGIDFGQTLNYSVSYKNGGDGAMKDIIIMAILQSDFLSWQSLNDKNNGQTSGNTISWSKAEIPALSDLASGAEATIDFSIALKERGEIDLSKSYEVKSLVNYSIDGKSDPDENKSNVIINKINSDLDLNEQLRYFNDDNIAVGYGPLPPKVNQTSSLKVFWSISNSLHELNDLLISVKLPPGAGWDDKNRSSVGSLYYDSQNNQAVWQIGRLPVSVYRADAEFNVTVSPREADRGKIMVILPGTTLSARDAVTGAQINKTLKAKTSKLEDDNLVSGDGVVQ